MTHEQKPAFGMRASGPAGRPAAGPPGPETDVRNTQVSGESERFPTPTVTPPLHSGSVLPARRGPGRLGLNALAERCSQRDRMVLAELMRHRFLTTSQVRRLCLPDHPNPATAERSTRKLLTRLLRWQLVLSLPRRVGGIHGGAAQSVWQLSSTGLRLLAFLDGQGDSRRAYEAGRLFVEHHLAIADAHLALQNAARSGAVELLDVQLEPECWRSYTDLSGAVQVIKPDLYAVTASGDYEYHWFIEVDRGTESMPTLLRQCQAYARYRASGQEQQNSGVFPFVVWLLNSERRRDRLLEAIGSAKHLERGLFHVLLSPGQLGPFVSGGAQ